MGFSSSSASRPSLAQRETLERLHAQHVSDVPQIGSESSEEACAPLLGLGRATAAYGGDAAPHIAPYDRSLLSLPGSGTQPVQLEDILDKHDRERIAGYREHLMISADDWGALCEKGDNQIASYTDPRLRGHSDDYKGFVEDLLQAGLHQPHLDSARDHLPFLCLEEERAAATGPGLPRSQPTVQEVGAHPTGLWLRVGRHRARARHRPVRLAERHQGLLLPLRSSCRTEPALLPALGPD